jgi:hypothetical protein
VLQSIFILASFLLATSLAQALPLADSSSVTRALPGAMATSDYDFTGIVGLSNCSGSLVRFEQNRDNDPAMILTNGHCLEGGFTPAGQFRYGINSSRSFNVLDPQAQVIGKVHANLVIYSTMTKTDLTLYRLVETYADIKTKFNVTPLLLASSHPQLNDKIEIISGFWKKGYSCSIHSFVNELREDEWTWVDSLRYSEPGCDTVGGTSGSPILLAGTRTVIGVNNTGNEDGEKCSLNNPCEVDEHGNISYERGTSYGQETHWLYTCLNNNNEVDLSVPGCLLPH